MKVELEHLSGSLQTLRRSSLGAYDAGALHQLRVGLRRMRSYLKSRSGSKARSLREELGRLADTTNAARDWDTLLEKAPTRLDPAHFRLLESDLRQHQEASHLPALAMLQSARWDHVMQQWDAYLRHHPPAHTAASASDKALRKARLRVARAWLRADLAGSPRHWHKLRIAVKDLRYRLEADPGTSRDNDASKQLRLCKRLQSLLGDWHDSVVHLTLVNEVAGSYDPARDVEKLKAAHDWCRVLEAEGQRCLEAAKASFRANEIEALREATEPGA